jgi:hypothetical protein
LDFCLKLLREKESEEMRDKIIEQNKPKSLPWRPNSSKTEILPLSNRCSEHSRLANNKSPSKKPAAKLETFYLDKDDNSKGMAFRQTGKSPSKALRKTIPTISITEKEENVTSKEVSCWPLLTTHYTQQACAISSI